MKLLNPRIDVVFKMLFTREPSLLRAMLEAVLAEPISSLQIQNPELPGDLTRDRNIVLDIRVLLANGARVDVEMQIRATAELRSRLVYYAARDYSKQLSRGDHFASLTPTLVVVWLDQPLFPETPSFHRVFELRERHTAQLFCDQLAIHVLQLREWRLAHPPFPSAHEAALQRWARFLSVESRQDLAQLAQEDPIMAQAADSLEHLSEEPVAARLAQDREDSAIFYQLGLSLSKQEGLVEGLRHNIAQFCKSFGIELTPARLAQFESSPEKLQRILDHLFAHRQWPE